VVFLEKTPIFFLRKLAKIGGNLDHNIDPRNFIKLKLATNDGLSGDEITFYADAGFNPDQGCQIFLDKIYQKGGKYTKLIQNYPMT
jgi:hypothetical protein